MFDPSGARVLTASDDRAAAGCRKRHSIRRAARHEHWVLSAVFDPSGARVLAASGDNTARIWRVFPTVRALVEHARTIMPRELTPAQHKQFFLD